MNDNDYNWDMSYYDTRKLYPIMNIPPLCVNQCKLPLPIPFKDNPMPKINTLPKRRHDSPWQPKLPKYKPRTKSL